MKRYRFNPHTMTYEEKEVPKNLYILKVLLVLVLTVALGSFYIWIYRSVLKWDLPKTAMLKSELVRWESRTKVLQRQMELYDNTLRGIEERDDNIYRSIFGLDSIVVNKSDTARELLTRLNLIEERVALRSISLDSIALIASTAGDMVSHVPAVPPVCPQKGQYRISSAFGRRVDPVHGGFSFHSGMDFAAKRNTPVFCTADGIVESAQCSSRGYGNELLINHGFGYKTRYAHLQTMSVTAGMKVRRGDQVGTIGNTGKSTGPHLHYEVIYKNSKMNPFNYMDLNMSVEEFQTMIESRESDSPYSTNQLSTSEILRRRK